MGNSSAKSKNSEKPEIQSQKTEHDSDEEAKKKLEAQLHENEKEMEKMRHSFDRKIQLLEQESLAAKSSLATSSMFDFNAEDLMLREDIVKLMPHVKEANSLAKQMEKDVRFEIVLVGPQLRGESSGIPEIYVQVVTGDKAPFYMRENNFMNRKYEMQEMFELSRNKTNIAGETPYELDPFYSSSLEHNTLGVATVFLSSLCFLLEHEERLPIFDFRAREIGHLDVKIWPASSKDKIIGSELTVHVEIKAAKGLPASVDSTFVKYSLLGQNELRSKTKSGLNPSFQSNLSVSLGEITEEKYKKLESEPLCFEVCSSHKRHFVKPRPPKPRLSQQIRDIEGLISSSNDKGLTELSISDLSMILNLPVPKAVEKKEEKSKTEKENKKVEPEKKKDEPPIKPPRSETPQSTSSKTCLIL